MVRNLLIFVYLLNPGALWAESFLIPANSRDSVFGDVEVVSASRKDTLLDIARSNALGYDEIVAANPGVNRWVPGQGTRVVLPKMYVLPDAPREGLVINLGELRLYYFAQRGELGQMVYTYPISIGRMDWKSPLGKTKIVSKEKNPPWRPPKSIKEEYASEGRPLPDVIPGGDPENPLGTHALRLGLTSYLIHGTDESKQYGIGMRVTHGCLRMYPEHVAELYELVPVGTPVLFVDQPVKVGWKGADLFIEVHAPLEEDVEEFEAYSHRVTLEEALELIAGKITEELTVSTSRIREIIAQGNGIPTPVAKTESGLPPPR
jgi:L,D-transpeptidase ErfK/SrfK